MEHLWDALHQHLHQRNPPSHMLLQLLMAQQHEWHNLPHFVSCLIASMHHHYQAVRVRGGHNWYWHFVHLYVRHTCICFRWIARDSVLDMYRVIPFPWCPDLWLLVSCLPVLLLNFENQYNVLIWRYMYRFHPVPYSQYIISVGISLRCIKCLITCKYRYPIGNLKH